MTPTPPVPPGGGMIEMGIFLTVLVLSSLALLAFYNPHQQQLQRRAVKMRERQLTGRQETGDHHAASLRRETEDRSLPLLGALVRRLPNAAQLRDRFEQAGVTISVERYLFISLSLVLGITLFLWLVLGKPQFTSLLFGVAIGVGAPHLVLALKARARLKRFLTQFPDALDLIVRGLRSGLPVTESVIMVAKEMEAPVAEIFLAITQRIALGMAFEQALNDMARKLRCTEFNFFATSIILQRETGGNLSEILSNLSDVLRKRLMMRLKIRAMSSEARASAMIIGALPFVVMGAVHFLSPDYLAPLIHDPRGNIAAAGAAISLLTGLGIMAKMTRFEI